MKTVLDAIDLIYESALKPSTWPSALQRVADCFDDAGAALFFQREDGVTGNIVSPGIKEAQHEYNLFWWNRDIRQTRFSERGFLARSDAITDRHLVSREELETDPIYTQFNPKHGLGWVAAVTVLPNPQWPVWLSVQRSRTKPEFCDEELELLARLGRHAENSLRLSMRVMNAEALTTNVADILADMDRGVVVLDASKQPIFQNEAARRALGKSALLSEALRRRSKNATRRASEGRALSSPPEAMIDDPGPLVIERGERRPLVFYFLPVKFSDAESVFFCRAQTIVIIVDLSVHTSPDPSLLRSVLGLTLAEARVAALVASGSSPKAVAASLGVAEGTVRKTLKNVFAKTGVNRQSELAVLASRLSLVQVEDR